PLVTGIVGYDPLGLKAMWTRVSLQGYKKEHVFEGDPTGYHASYQAPTGGVRLVHFDTNTYQGLSQQAAFNSANQDGVQLAGIEVLEKLIVEPGWALDWNGASSPYPMLSPIRVKRSSGWGNAPYIYRQNGPKNIKFVTRSS
ncbi:MAG TPA: hypothetical protein PLY16_02880, partial [Candidatus Saccharibacteria bacterium]|nr:hypothetical protein [Candidatus Saccharibacteria bacterium]